MSSNLVWPSSAHTGCTEARTPTLTCNAAVFKCDTVPGSSTNKNAEMYHWTFEVEDMKWSKHFI